MKITADWITSPPSKRLMSLFDGSGHVAYFVGGCVRNEIISEPVSDLDISTSAPPELVMALAKNANIKAIPTGIDHGTVTLVIDAVPFEITSFRKDIETDGRHAVVSYSNNIEDDAQRRDFTMNAIYMDRAGKVIDPLGGMNDLKLRQVRFIGDADTRIHEDYLRILRFFRFFAWYGNPELGIDPVGLAACAQNLAGLETLSKERIGAEMLKLLNAPSPSLALGAMDRSGVLGAILPGVSTKSLFIVLHCEMKIDRIARLAALGGENTRDLLRLSNSDAKKLKLYRHEMGSSKSISEVAYSFGFDAALSIAVLRSAVFEAVLEPDVEEDIRAASGQNFPVKSQDLMPKFQGKALGEALKALELKWIRSGFEMTKSDLLNGINSQ